MWDIFKRTNIHIMGVPKGEKNKKKKNQKQILEEIMADEKKLTCTSSKLC